MLYRRRDYLSKDLWSWEYDWLIWGGDAVNVHCPKTA